MKWTRAIWTFRIWKDQATAYGPRHRATLRPRLHRAKKVPTQVLLLTQAGLIQAGSQVFVRRTPAAALIVVELTQIEKQRNLSARGVRARKRGCQRSFWLTRYKKGFDFQRRMSDA
jgi:hypothetical protein